MTVKKLRMSAFLAIILAIIALVTLSASTYAWFTFRAATNVTPLSGTISNGDGDLLISNSPSGPFDTTCTLILRNPEAELVPLSTADLESFYSVSAQNTSGIATAYRQANELSESNTLNGSVYLFADGNDFDVYFWLPNVNCGEEPQSLAAMRLGLRITTQRGTSVHIFRLDELGNTAGAESRITVPQPNCVVERIDANGAPLYSEDRANNLSSYAARGTEENVQAGDMALCTITDGEIARVDYWLYLEGCDENCINSVQGKDIALQLAFAGNQNS